LILFISAEKIRTSTNILIRINIAAPKPNEDWLFTNILKKLKDDL
tara:strand:+ start:870 stop:1004 length:135 start_codon:yes stop_codon:yes gene_type:complete